MLELGLWWIESEPNGQRIATHLEYYEKIIKHELLTNIAKGTTGPRVEFGLPR